MHADFLFITAEIAAAFAGFASLVAIISTRGDRSPAHEELDFLTLRNVLFLSLMTIFFALLPNLLGRLLSETVVAWRAAAVGYVVVVAPYTAYFYRLMSGVYGGIGTSVPSTFHFNATLLLLSAIAMTLTATNAVAPEIYLLGVANLLYNAGFGFVRLFVSLRPQPTSN